ncbi:hypothetical protein IFM89_016834 [Coptis chinensis]|uniref:F-box domain-containing protein n=1 Tax=Coptis chinensis TaxID=261450 RepID=A0A835GWK0_9MAGN|nr:hypothetical protein IFM89_016834 [Coptis chinensis]
MDDLLNFPSDILFDILSRIPIKSIVILRCVSKPWLDKLTDSFVMNCTKKRPKLLSRYIPDVSYQARSKHITEGFMVSSVDYGESHKVVEVNSTMPDIHSYTGDFEAWNSCDGLLCLTYCKEFQRKVLCLWNPTTGDYMEFPTRDRCPYSLCCGHKTVFSVGFNPNVNSYFVIRIETHSLTCDAPCSHVYIFYLAYGSWWHVQEICYKIPPKQGALVNGALHWLGASCTGTSYDLVIAFVIKGRKFQEVLLPYFGDMRTFSMDITELGGELCLFCDFKSSVTLWLMKDYSVKESWTKMFSIKKPIGEFHTRNLLIPLCFTTSGALILIKVRTLVLYDPKDGKLVSLKIEGIPGRSQAFTTYIESPVRIKSSSQIFDYYT